MYQKMHDTEYFYNVRSHQNIGRLKTGKLILLAGTAILVFVIVSIICDYDNSVVFTGDEWDYQSIGVNSYYGYEFPTTGRLKETDLYKFTGLDEGKIRFWEGFSGIKAYYRVPFYPLFVSIIYKYFGINPIIIKYIQLFLCVMSGLILVLIGKMAWGERGFFIGYLSFIIFVCLNYRFTAHLMPENWQFLFLSVITACLFIHYKGSGTYSVILGLTLGLSCLNKGTTFFLFPIIIVADLFFWRIKNKSHWKNMVLFAVSFAVITGLWSVYVSHERNQLTFLSAQTDEVLLDGNNEYCSDGLWHPEWRDKPDSWYFTDNLEKRPGILRVINFYVKNPRYVSNIPAKFKAGFAPVHSFIALISLYLVFLASVIYWKSTFPVARLNRTSLRIGTLLLLCLSICFGFFSGSFNDILFFSIVTLIFVLSVVFGRRLIKELKLPYEFYIILLNFMIFTLAFYVCNETYPSRYVKTMDGIFILSGFYFLFEIYNFARKKPLKFHKE
jgi:4-amino-4-deoxy-L-arabinose transferase-like glycosyltransferase